MKLLTTLLTLTAALSASASVWNPIRDECQKYHPKAHANINRFCSINNMVVPSFYTTSGRSGQSNSRVWIQSTPANSCRPPQWVPQAICRQQSYTMCAAHQKTRFYGKKLCQMWRIQYGKGAMKPGISDKWPFKSIMVPIKKRVADMDGDDVYGLVKEDQVQDEDDVAPAAA